MSDIDLNTRFNFLLTEFTRKYLNYLVDHAVRGERTYGFEYEFLPRHPLTALDLSALFDLLISVGMKKDGGELVFEHSTRISFEPGGQIEYCSPPLTKYDSHIFNSIIQFICQTNTMIQSELGIEYVGTGFFSGRGGTQLCLKSPRYIFLHERLSHSGSRGLEMMKGTASIHLHAAVSGLDNLLPLFYQMCALSTHSEFKMSSERRDIWDNTDPVRCGLPPCCFDRPDSPAKLIQQLIRFALHAEVLGEDVPFYTSVDQSFKAFLNHMTTLFTDVRFNLKGPTLELRTLDSLPVSQFVNKWNLFIGLFDDI